MHRTESRTKKKPLSSERRKGNGGWRTDGAAEMVSEPAALCDLAAGLRDGAIMRVGAGRRKSSLAMPSIVFSSVARIAMKRE
jgi:hypothetical protein